MRIVPTFRGATFVPGDVDAVVVSDDSEWDCWRQRHDPIAHIEVSSGTGVCAPPAVFLVHRNSVDLSNREIHVLVKQYSPLPVMAF